MWSSMYAYTHTHTRTHVWRHYFDVAVNPNLHLETLTAAIVYCIWFFQVLNLMQQEFHMKSLHPQCWSFCLYSPATNQSKYWSRSRGLFGLGSLTPCSMIWQIGYRLKSVCMYIYIYIYLPAKFARNTILNENFLLLVNEDSPTWPAVCRACSSSVTDLSVVIAWTLVTGNRCLPSSAAY